MDVSDYTGQTVGISHQSTPDAYGDPAYLIAVDYPARYEARSTLVLNAQGQQVVSNGRLFLATTCPVAVDDRATYAGKTFHVISVESAEGLDGPSHSIAYLGG